MLSMETGKGGPLERLGFYRVLPVHRIPVNLSLKILIVFCILILVGFLVTLKLSLDMIDENILKRSRDKLDTDLKTVMLVYRDALREIEMVMDFTSNRFFLIEGIEAGDFGRIASQLELIRQDRGLDIFALADKEGRVVFRTTAPYRQGDLLLNDPLIRQALAGKKCSGTVLFTRERLEREGEALVAKAFVAGKETERALPPFFDNADSGLLLMAVYPVVNRNGAILGVLYGGRLLNNDNGLVDAMVGQVFPAEEAAGGNAAMASIFLRDTRVATSIVLPDGNRALGHRMDGSVREAVLTNGRALLGDSWVVSDWFYAAYEPLRDPAGEVIGAVGIGLMQRPFIELRRQFILRLIKISGLGLAIALAMGLVFSRMLTKPLRGLAEASRELAKGNLDFRVRIKPGRDEIRELETAFNTMAKNLNQSMADKVRMASELTDLNQRYMELLGFASHELKQPVGVIAATVANLRKMGPFISPDKFEAMLDRLDRNAAYINSMSEKYLHYSKIESGELTVYVRETPVLSDVIDPALEGEQKAVLEKKMVVEIPEREILKNLVLLIDPEMMRVVFANLIGNAVKFGYQGGYLRLGFRETDDSYLFNIKNNGEGFPPEKAGDLFVKFRRLENGQKKHKGAGLGLFNARRIVELHGGTIWAESEPGAFANFVFKLPKERVNVARAPVSDFGREDDIWGY